MKSYRIRLALLSERPATEARAGDRRAHAFWEGLQRASAFNPESKRRVGDLPENWRLEPLGVPQIALREYVLRQELAPKLQSLLREAGSDALLVAVTIEGYGSLDLLTVFDKSLSEAVAALLGSLVSACVAGIFEVPANAMAGGVVVENKDESGDAAGLGKRLVDAGKKATPTLTVAGALLIGGFLCASFLDRLSDRWDKVDTHYSKLTDQQLDTIKKLADVVTTQNSTRDSAADKLVSRIFEQAQKISERRSPKCGPTVCDMLKPALKPASLRLVVDEDREARSPPNAQK
jgi:hypothetical protein